MIGESLSARISASQTALSGYEPVIAIVIPTYLREQVLVDSIAALLAQLEGRGELIVVDQTPAHEPAVTQQLQIWSDGAVIRWIRLQRPSITAAMNAGWVAARAPIITYVDDDIEPHQGFVDAHLEAHRQYSDSIIAGRVLQPWHIHGAVARTGLAGDQGGLVSEFMGGNFSLQRQLLRRLGGFDENFVRVAYRFEAEFSLRARRAGVPLQFCPEASLNHLRASAGGTRSYGDHLRTLMPSHAVGEYYFLIGSRPQGWWRRLMTRWGGSVATRHHLRRPWWIPVTLIAESAGLIWAFVLFLRGKRLVRDAS